MATSRNSYPTGLIVKPERNLIFNLENGAIAIIDLTSVTSDNVVLFKVKSTNPDLFSITPSSGYIMPMATCQVKIELRSPDPESLFSEKTFNKHKLLIVDNTFYSFDTICESNVEVCLDKQSKTNNYTKLNCIFMGKDYEFQSPFSSCAQQFCGKHLHSTIFEFYDDNIIL